MGIVATRTTEIHAALASRGNALLEWRPFRAWIGSRLKPSGKCRFVRQGDLTERLRVEFDNHAVRSTLPPGVKEMVDLLLHHECHQLFLDAELAALQHLAYLKHPDADVRWLAARSTSFYGDNVLLATNFGPVVKQSGTPDRNITIIEALIDALHDPVSKVRLASLNSFAWLADEEIVSVSDFYHHISQLRADPSRDIQLRVSKLLAFRDGIESAVRNAN